MTSLAEAYEENVGEVANVRLLSLGAGLFVTGALLVVLAILLSTTGLQSVFGLEWWQAREVAGVLAGLGVPAVFIGIFSVLPASQRVQAAAAIGAGVSILGVALFTHAYPKHWAGYGQQLSLPVVAVYFTGLLVTFGCLFIAVVNFKTRNDPGGTVTLELNREGEVETVEVQREELADFEDLEDVSAFRTDLADTATDLADTETDPTDTATDEPKTGLGGVAFVGKTPDGDAPTQTNHPNTGNTPNDGGNQSVGLGASPSPQSDGGTASNDIQSPLDDTDTPEPGYQRTTDAYCGNCEHFEYVRTDKGMQPHCGYYARMMDDMDACEEWEPNS